MLAPARAIPEARDRLKWLSGRHPKDDSRTTALRLTRGWGSQILKLAVRLFAALALGLTAVVLYGAAQLRADETGERRIQMFNIHTEESIDIVYKKDGEFIPEALEKLNYFMRDWRMNKVTKMDPHTIDLVWEIHEELGSKVPIHLICGYRTADTNEALRHAGGGQAQHSQHILGKAMDVTFPDVPVQKLRYAGLVREAGGVGYYPTSGVPFVHIDTGTVRMWPRMPRAELALLFPSGHSKFTPADGRPITLADVGYARTHYTQLADAIAAFHQFRAEAKDRTLVASLDTNDHGAGSPAAAAEDAALPPEPVSVPAAKAVVLAQAEPASSARETAPVLNGPALKPATTRVIVKVGKPVVANVTLASLSQIVPPRPALAVRPLVQRASKALPISATVTASAEAAVDGAVVPPEPEDGKPAPAFMNQAGWVSAPDYDEEHDNELSYRPFPLASLIEANPSMDNPVLAKLSRPNLVAAHDMIGEDDGIRMRFRPTLQVAEMIWNDDQNGNDPNHSLYGDATGGQPGQGRAVKTASAN